ncbi:Uncharacterized protein BP5553_06602 [Venustampulla echinocandica]|uniref:Six-hairpin glycosidase n=1 Tax=Venustampulla echinocandica TaxID=2656787 RepID=A0A370TKE1_9HELO|nr:Uncharacterized protein BP5553_06602 [Venustampulla echinocandica]RDL35990.1 Uncharacterized protein BP5553_06602 [Venustampulla echinocandica]
MSSFTIKVEVHSNPLALDETWRIPVFDGEASESFPQATPISSKLESTAQLADDVQGVSYPKTPLGVDLAGLFAENVLAKIYRTATGSISFSAESRANISQGITPSLESIPRAFPEYVPQDGPRSGHYELREPEFWTCGFFPGSLHGILERLTRFPQSIKLPNCNNNRENRLQIAKLRSDFFALCQIWAEHLHAMASRTDTHDIGFIIMPALRLNWELTGNTRTLDSIIRAAQSLASRFVPSAKAIRSWDARIQKNIQITCMDQNLILIIDSLCNLDLLYYASNHCSDGAELYDIATAHATTLLRTHLRPENFTSASDNAYRGRCYSTYHVANLEPQTGNIKKQFTAQGHSDTSTWARGQAWAILGYAQTYMWTKDKKFLQASCGLAEYFMHRLEAGPPFLDADMADNIIDAAPGRHRGGRYVPLWDFDAPIEDPSTPLRDSSAGAIAANGMLVLSQGLAGAGYDNLAARFRSSAIDLAHDLVNFAVAPEKARFVAGANGDVRVEDVIQGCTFDGILKFGTANNNENAQKRYANHGLVYGDYYLVELGNRLLRMGLD